MSGVGDLGAIRSAEWSFIMRCSVCQCWRRALSLCLAGLAHLDLLTGPNSCSAGLG